MREKYWFVRFFLFLCIGTLNEVIGIALFSFAKSYLGTDLGNLAALLPSIAFTFFVHSNITWGDRKGTLAGKARKFAAVKLPLFFARGLIFPLFRRIPLLSCPLQPIVLWSSRVSNLMGIPLFGQFLVWLSECDHLSLALYDLIVILAAYFIFDRFSFAKTTNHPIKADS